MKSKNTICLWYEGDALGAARFYAETFPDSSVGAIHHAPGDFPDGKEGDVLVVEFTVAVLVCAPVADRVNPPRVNVSVSVVTPARTRLVWL